jgi:hypothetical protein
MAPAPRHCNSSEVLYGGCMVIARMAWHSTLTGAPARDDHSVALQRPATISPPTIRSSMVCAGATSSLPHSLARLHRGTEYTWGQVIEIVELETFCHGTVNLPSGPAGEPHLELIRIKDVLQ